MANDPTIQWLQATRFGIENDADADAWHSGHVTDLAPLTDTQDAVLVATETGGVWVIVGTTNPLQLSDTWDKPDVQSLAQGPDAPRHFFAGCCNVYYSGDPSGLAPVIMAPVIMETDLSVLAPLLNWLPVTPALPATAGRVSRIAVLRTRRRIVVACAKIRAGDTGGIFWADIPPSRLSALDPPRSPYDWKQAKIPDDPSPNGFWDVAVAARYPMPVEQLEDLNDVLIVAGGYRGGALYVGRWEGTDLVFRRPSIAFEDGTDATAIFFQNAGTTSVSVCAMIGSVVYAASAWPDGRLSGVLRSKSGGRDWIYCKAAMANAASPLDLLVLRTGAQGSDWNNRIAAHSGNPGIAALGWQNGTFLTLDEGQEWRLIDGGKHMHGDVHALVFHKEVADSIGFLFVGSDGGLVRVNLDDFLGLTGTPFRSDYNRNLPTLQCYSNLNLTRQYYGSMDGSTKRPGLVATGLQDNGNVFCTLTPLEPWRHVDEGDGGWNAFLADDAYANNIKGEPVVVTTLPGPAVTTPFPAGALASYVVPIGSPPQDDPGGLKGPVAEPVMRPRFKSSDGWLMLALASSGYTIYGLFSDGGAQPKYRFDCLGAVPLAEYVMALASFQGDRVFAGTSAGNIYSLDTASRTVANQPIKLPKPSASTRMQGGWIPRIVGFDDSRMFAALVSAVEAKIITLLPPLLNPLSQTYVLAFDGAGWSNSPSIGLPNEFIYAMLAVAVPQTRLEHGLLVATDGAVYVSRDDAQTWQPASAGLPRRPHCADLRFVSRAEGGTIYLSTYGRSLWTASV
jgi:hypothetical protein